MHTGAMVQAGIKVASRAGARTIWAQVCAAVVMLTLASLPTSLQQAPNRSPQIVIYLYILRAVLISLSSRPDCALAALSTRIPNADAMGAGAQKQVGAATDVQMAECADLCQDAIPAQLHNAARAARGARGGLCQRWYACSCCLRLSRRGVVVECAGGSKESSGFLVSRVRGAGL